MLLVMFNFHIMKLSTKGEYGLLAILDLAIHAQESPVQSSQIADRQKIPKQYLDQLMLVLKKSGMVESSRGRQGGYQLARPSNKINLFEVITALEGPITEVKFFAKQVQANQGTREILRELWFEIFDQAAERLRNLTLEEVCEKGRQMDQQIMYYI